MARPKKLGLDYFPLDVDIFEDERLFDVQEEYGPLGEVVFVRLLCLIYKNGYYYQFGSLERLAAVLLRSIGNRCGADKYVVVDIIRFLGQVGLLSAKMMDEENVLTSQGIQERFLRATERRLEREPLLYALVVQRCLVEEHEAVADGNGVNVDNNEVNVDINAVNADNNPQSKVEESKVEESKGNESKGEGEALAAPSRALLMIPSVEEVKAYCAKKAPTVDGQRFYDYYSSIGWRRKGMPIADWQAVVRNWAQTEGQNGAAFPSGMAMGKKKGALNNYTGRKWDFEKLERLAQAELEARFEDVDVGS